MSGHSKWATIKHKKAAADAKRGAAFSKILREITAIAKSSGGDIETNPSLRNAIDRARGMNTPKDKIETAIKKGTGEIEGVSYDEVSFDAYGPAGVAMIITGLTDNKNRTTAEIKNILSKKKGNLGAPGSTSHMFTKKGFVSVEASKTSEEELMDIVLDAGAEDIKQEGDFFEITCEIGDLMAVKDALTTKEIPTTTAEMTMLPSTTVQVTGSDVKTLLGLMEALEEHEDVQNVYANFDIDDSELESAAE